MKQKKIVFLGTGGTVAGIAANALDHTGYQSAQLGIGALLGALPLSSGGESAALVYVAEQVAQIDSKDMGFAVWAHLAERVVHWLACDDVQGIVIAHGTDTLEESAYFLHAFLAPSKPVVFTCAMRPSTALSPDGPQNMMDALAVASHPDARGVTVVCAGAVFGPEDVQKMHPYRLNAFSSGDAGQIAYVEEGLVRQLRAWPQTSTLASNKASLRSFDARLAKLLEATWPRVEIVMSYAGADGHIVRALVGAGVQGLVVAATGNGTVHQDLEAALLWAMAQGIKVSRATRCPEGRILPGANDRLPVSPGLTPVKARIAMMLDLMQV